MLGCFAPSGGRALEERRRPFGDPSCVKRPVSERRMTLPTPFETKRKKAPLGALGRIQHLSVAERVGPDSNVLHVVMHCCCGCATRFKLATGTDVTHAQIK